MDAMSIHKMFHGKGDTSTDAVLLVVSPGFVSIPEIIKRIHTVIPFTPEIPCSKILKIH